MPSAQQHGRSFPDVRRGGRDTGRGTATRTAALVTDKCRSARAARTGPGPGRGPRPGPGSVALPGSRTAQGGPDPLVRSALREDEIGSPTSAHEDQVMVDSAGGRCPRRVGRAAEPFSVCPDVFCAGNGSTSTLKDSRRRLPGTRLWGTSDGTSGAARWLSTDLPRSPRVTQPRDPQACTPRTLPRPPIGRRRRTPQNGWPVPPGSGP